MLPSLLAGVLTNILTGVFVNRMPVFWAVLLSAALSAAAPLLMALIRPEQLYWENAFFAQVHILLFSIFIQFICLSQDLRSHCPPLPLD